MRMFQLSRLSLLSVLVGWTVINSYALSVPRIITQKRGSSRLSAKPEHSCHAQVENDAKIQSRRSLFRSVAITAGSTASSMVLLQQNQQRQFAWAAERVPLESSLYTILRVREATQQESRLIKSGKFKDVQRANVKLAVKFMIENYRLNDAFVAASSYLDGNDRRVAAVSVGQAAVQDLYTILEYFDAADVQNLKIGSSNLSSDKESVVLKGLDATRRSIDDFLAYFPKEMVDSVKDKVKEENDLNFKEFDRNLGDIVNPNPSV